MALVRKAVNPDDTEQLARITLQFDSRNADWSGARYRALVEWLTARTVGQGIDVSVCRPLVAETLWDTAARVAQRHESETSNPHSGCVRIVSAVPAEAATAGERGNESAVVNAHGHVEPAGNANARSGEQNGIQVSLAHTFCPLLYRCCKIGNTVTPPSVPPERLQNSDAGRVRIDPEDMRIQPANWVNCMRVKNPLPATIPHGGRPKPSPTNKSFLPIKAWILGRKLFEEPYHLVWATDGKLTIKSGDAPDSPSRHSEEADLPSLAKCVWFVDPKEDFPDKFFVLETYEKNKRQKPMAVNYTSFFKQGASHGEGDIMLKFNTESPAWTIATYTAFVDWFKVHVHSRQIFRGRAGVARWDTSNRMVLLAETRIKREPHSGVKRHADGEVDPASRKKRKIVTRNNG
ncbi:hypothetical protein B0H11DRAFT_404887 [Mycena galericulata]|nr:hypothetical protein B0H11DRAFT_404887 [Mycena galericulata]